VTLSSGMEELLQTTRRVQVIFERPAPPRDFKIPGAWRQQAEGPVVTAMASIANEAQLEPVRQLPGARVNVFPASLEEIFLERFGPAENVEEQPISVWQSPGDAPEAF
ncbi:MAG TPA: hypothetical protein VHH73_00710, partial [Verrucomicrobiae bacterium]|nr:hypothetical protein [Verrucomicrobiae bacterium]